MPGTKCVYGYCDHNLFTTLTNVLLNLVIAVVNFMLMLLLACWFTVGMLHWWGGNDPPVSEESKSKSEQTKYPAHAVVDFGGNLTDIVRRYSFLKEDNKQSLSDSKIKFQPTTSRAANGENNIRTSSDMVDNKDEGVPKYSFEKEHSKHLSTSEPKIKFQPTTSRAANGENNIRTSFDMVDNKDSGVPRYSFEKEHAKHLSTSESKTRFQPTTTRAANGEMIIRTSSDMIDNKDAEVPRYSFEKEDSKQITLPESKIKFQPTTTKDEKIIVTRFNSLENKDAGAVEQPNVLTKILSDTPPQEKTLIENRASESSEKSKKSTDPVGQSESSENVRPIRKVCGCRNPKCKNRRM